MVRTSPRKKKQSVISFEKSKTPLTKVTPNSAKKETVTTTTKTKVESAKSVTPKRKASQRDEDEFTPGGKAESELLESEPPAKKQKTKGPAGKAKGKGKTKEEDMKPLAARTAVASLKKAMYIGAHISAAGGPFIAFLVSSVLRNAWTDISSYTIAIPLTETFVTLHRSPQRRPKRQPHRRQFLRPLPQVSAQMD
jgi:hypothetical protein